MTEMRDIIQGDPSAWLHPPVDLVLLSCLDSREVWIYLIDKKCCQWPHSSCCMQRLRLSAPELADAPCTPTTLRDGPDFIYQFCITIYWVTVVVWVGLTYIWNVPASYKVDSCSSGLAKGTPQIQATQPRYSTTKVTLYSPCISVQCCFRYVSSLKAW